MAKKKKKAVKKAAKHASTEELPSKPYETIPESLMPELEELVKKNPNRLIGCGG
jgi:hypothetical protein